MSEVSEDHPGQHHAEYPNLVGFKAGYLSILAPEDGLVYTPAFFAGLSYERTLIHDWLEAEVTVPVAVLFAEAETLVTLPVDVHFKKPFHPHPQVSPYVALGPTFDIVVAPKAEVFFGISAAIGTYLWPTRRIGVDLEIDYNILSERGRPVHEILVAAGPVYRF